MATAALRRCPSNPILAGQEFYYLYVQLKDFKSGLRKSAIMGPIVQALQPDAAEVARAVLFQADLARHHARSGPGKSPGREGGAGCGRMHLVSPGRFPR